MRLLAESGRGATAADAGSAPPWSRLSNVPRSAALNVFSGSACHPVAMNLKQTASITAAVVALVTSVATSAAAPPAAPSPSNFVSRVDNPWFPLRPGTTLRYNGEKDGERQTDVMTVTHKTKTI